MALRSSLAALLAVMLLAPAAASAQGGYDDLPGVELGDVPYTGAASVLTKQTFDNSDYDAIEEYNASPNAFAACGSWGTKSAWMRFTTAVRGFAYVSVNSAAKPYDVLYIVYKAPATSAPTLANLEQHNCKNDNVGAPNESYIHGYLVEPNTTFYVQVMSVCSPDGACDDAELAAAVGGPTTVDFRFTPDNGDGDGVPDTLDACAATAGPAAGCPDADGDGVGEPADACPGVRGKGADGCRLPDEDGDGFAAFGAAPGMRDCDDDRADVFPATAEIRGNTVDENCDGLAALDRDGDGVDDAPGPDCDPANAAIHPGAPDLPGNGVDDDCAGGDAPFPRVTSGIAPVFLKDARGRTVGFARFTVLNVVAGMRVRIECRGDRCPYGAKAIKVKKSRSQLVVGRAFDGRRLPVGAKVTIKVMRAGHVGRALSYTIRRKGKPKLVKRCTPPGRTRTVKC